MAAILEVHDLVVQYGDFSGQDWPRRHRSGPLHRLEGSPRTRPTPARSLRPNQRRHTPALWLIRWELMYHAAGVEPTLAVLDIVAHAAASH